MSAPLAYDGCSRLDAAGRPRSSPFYEKLLREAAAERATHPRMRRFPPLPSRAVDRVSNVPPR